MLLTKKWFNMMITGIKQDLGGYKLLYIKVSITVFVLFLLFLFMPNTEETDKSKSINNAIRRDKEKIMEKEGKKNENEQK